MLDLHIRLGKRILTVIFGKGNRKIFRGETVLNILFDDRLDNSEDRNTEKHTENAEISAHDGDRHKNTER